MRMPFGVERMMYGCAPVCAGAAFIAALDNSPLRSSILTPVVAKIEAA